jgi:hypothetical protein
MPATRDGDPRDKARVERAREAARRRQTRRHKLATRQRESEKADAAVERLSATLTNGRTKKE